MAFAVDKLIRHLLPSTMVASLLHWYAMHATVWTRRSSCLKAQASMLACATKRARSYLEYAPTRPPIIVILDVVLQSHDGIVWSPSG